MDPIPLLVPQMPTAEQLLPMLREIDANRHYTNFGPLTARFERAIVKDVAPWLDSSHVTTVANCTIGLELALQALGLPRGASVLIPALTFVATGTAVMRAGLHPVIADVDPANWTLTPKIAEEASSRLHLDAVMPVATFGRGQDASAWDDFTAATGVPALIDAAGAFGNQALGATTDIVFSFHATKSFGAAEGGAVLSTDASRIARIRKLSNFGINLETGQVDDLAGTNGKMSEYHAAVALNTFQVWPQVRRELSSLHQRYLSLLRERLPSLSFQDKPDNGAYALLPILLPGGILAQDVATALAELGIATRRWYCPSLHLHPALKGARRMESMEVAPLLGERILGLPFFIGMTDGQIARVISALERCLGFRKS